MFIHTLTVAAATLAFAAPANAAPCGRAVPLQAAQTAPTGAAILQPGQRVQVPRDTSDVNAYRWNGRAFGPQCGRHWRSVWGRVVAIVCGSAHST